MPHHADLPPEWQLLLACVTRQPTSAALQRLAQELASPTVDWERLVDHACQHGIAPLVYHSLQQVDGTWERVPAAFAQLQGAYYSTAARNALLYRELQMVLRALRAVGHAVIVLKGAALADTVYPNRALRPMGDIDLLVKREEVGQVEDLLTALGYELNEEQRSRKAWYYAHYYHLVFQQKRAALLPLAVEVHWHVHRPDRRFRIDVGGLWERAVPTTIADVDALVLSPEDSLLYSCWHICKHGLTGGFRAFCDIAAILGHYKHTLDWDQVCRRAAHWQITPYVFLPLQLAQELLGASVPASALAVLTPQGFDDRLFEWAKEEIFEDQSTIPLVPQLLHLWRGPGFTDRMAIMRQLMSPAVVRQYYAIPPASKKLCWYYLMRLKDLLWRYGPVFWRLLRCDQHLTARAEGKLQLTAWLAPFEVSDEKDREASLQKH